MTFSHIGGRRPDNGLHVLIDWMTIRAEVASTSENSQKPVFMICDNGLHKKHVMTPGAWGPTQVTF